MADIQAITYNNGKNLLVGCTNKSGSSSAIAMLAYPLLGEIKYRDQRRPLMMQRKWKECHLHQIQNQAEKTFPVRIAIIRDPVERFISAYKDRVKQRNKDSTREWVTDFDFFINNIDYIRSRSRDIRNHTQSQTVSLGSNPAFYTDIILTKDIDTKLKQKIEEVSQVSNVPTPREKNSDRIAQVVPTADHVKQIKKLFEDDYRVWGNYFNS